MKWMEIYLEKSSTPKMIHFVETCLGKQVPYYFFAMGSKENSFTYFLNEAITPAGRLSRGVIAEHVDSAEYGIVIPEDESYVEAGELMLLARAVTSDADFFANPGIHIEKKIEVAYDVDAARVMYSRDYLIKIAKDVTFTVGLLNSRKYQLNWDGEALKCLKVTNFQQYLSPKGMVPTKMVPFLF